jgi:DNA-binding response OmpR family regulator
MSRDQILVVDDNEDIRIFVRAALTPEGFDVIEASNGTDALAIFRKSEPAVIILDLSIGQPDGFEVCREIRKSSTVPIIMLTSHVEEMDEAMCLAAGADDYITKPVSARILALRTTTQIRHRAAQNIVQGAIITAGPLTLNTETRELTVESKKVEFISLLPTQSGFLPVSRLPRRLAHRWSIQVIISSTLTHLASA